MTSHSDPLVSIVIVTHNRASVCVETVEQALALAYEPKEIVVVDNASEDGTARVLQEEFGDRIVIVRRSDRSPTAGRNEGIERSSGAFILTLDDDIRFVRADPIGRIVELFGRHPGVGVLAFRLVDAESGADIREHWWHGPSVETSAEAQFLSDYFPEGAACFRRSLIDQVGGYRPELFRGAENIEFSLRILRAGWSVLYTPDVTATEVVRRPFTHQTVGEVNYLTLRNRLWAAWLHMPLLNAAWYGGSRIAVAFVRSLRHGWTGDWFRGVRDGAWPPATIRADRRPMPRAVVETRRALRRSVPVFAPRSGSGEA